MKRKYRGETLDKSKQYVRMRQTKMKEFYYVRYNQSAICLGKNVSDMKKLAFAVANKLKRFEGIDIEVPKVVDMRKGKICFHILQFVLLCDMENMLQRREFVLSVAKLLSTS